MSGAPTDFLKNHPIDNVNKSLRERINALDSILINFLRYDVRFAGKICSFTIQGIRDRLTLRTLSLRGKDDYVYEEILSAVFPLSWDFRFQFYKIFNMMEYIIISVIEYPNVIKELLEHPADLDESSIRYCISDSGCYRDY
ncbi:hypothetical protein F8M41_012560 [Gigaspora margarita]|uniref:Uncharacterized protein n=1 Tax=Gigaspora margarita TaxID=4874 RepID=A0A8H3WYW3_GIGMA|nr:hypothetical protein F8M41_012560 [Gigaspora margarita]